MPDIVLKKPDLPFVIGGTSELTVHLGTLTPTQPLPDATDTVFDVGASGSASAPVNIGGEGSWTISLKAGAAAKLRVIRPGATKLIEQYGLSPYFAAQPQHLALLFDVGANADGQFAGKVSYGALTAGAQLAAGADAKFAYVRPYPKQTPVTELIPDFFSHVRVPALIATAPAAGEVTTFEYGGYLKVGLQIGAGYQIKGTPSTTIGGLTLSEHYELSVLGTLGFNAQVAGAFSVEVRGATDAAGAPEADWARVVVRKSRSDKFGVAADVSVSAKAAPKGLPEAPNEFLGALVGVNVKNWLHVIDQVRTLSDWDNLKDELDSLAKGFVGEWIGKAFDAIDKTEVPAILARVQQVTDAYNHAEATVISAFDRYFEQLTSPVLSDVARAVDRIAHLASWDSLKGDIDPLVWRLITELTGGDPLDWIVTKEVTDLQKLATQLLDLVSNAAHAELRSVITLAKERFGLNPLFGLLDKIDSPAKLKAEATTRAGAMVERLTGKVISTLRESELEPLRKHLHDVLEKAQAFEALAYKKFADALTQNASFKLHAEYSRARQDEALLDVSLNVGTEEGRQLLRACALGDFDRALANFRPGLVRVNRGRLVHNVVKQSAVSVNVVGWHAGWHYAALDQLILNAEQRIVTETNGALSIYTQVDLTKKRERKRNQERTLTNFLLRFLGESHGVLEKDPASAQYLIDVITGMSARYELTFEDAHTTAKELAYYVSFAQEFGLGQPGLQPEALAALLPKGGPDDFGPISAHYDVRYAERALLRLFSQPLDPAIVRRTLRRVILAGYLRGDPDLRQTGWAYWTPGVYDLWKTAPASFAKSTPQQYAPIAQSPFPAVPAPAAARVDPARQLVLNTLYLIEEDFVAGLAKLQQLIAAAPGGTRLSPAQFEAALGRFGSALAKVDDFDEAENGVFAVFDELQRQAAPAARTSSLTLESTVGGKLISKVFLTPQEG